MRNLCFYAFCIAVALTGSSAMAEDKPLPNPLMRCEGEFGLCSYYDRYTGKDVIPPQFERAMLFSEGLAAVRIKGRFGYIDEKGEVVIAPQFDLAGSFYHGLAEVVVENKAGVINHEGKIVVEPQFARAVPFTSEVVIAQEGEWSRRHFTGRERLEGLDEPGFHLYPSDYLHPAGLYHITKGWVGKPVYFDLQFARNGEDLLFAKTGGRDIETVVTLGPDGPIPPDARPQAYSYTQQYSEGLAIVASEVDAPEGGRVKRWGAIDSDGKLVVPLVFEHLSYWNNGYGIAHKGGLDGKKALVNKSGELLAGRYFDEVERPEEGKPPRVLENGQWFAVSADGVLTAYREKESDGGAPVIRSKNENAPSKGSHEERKSLLTCPGGLTLFEKEGKWGMKAADGSVFIRAQYRAISCFDQGVAWVPDDDKQAWCPLGIDGKPQAKPACQKTFYNELHSSAPERFDDDPYESSVLFSRAYLDYGLGQRRKAPTWSGTCL